MFTSIRNGHGEWLDTTWHAPEGQPHAIVVIGHGVTANKDREWAVTLAEALAAAGHGALRFSFSGNGDSEGEFEDSCPTKEADDLASVLDAVEEAAVDLGCDHLVYVGHSMGAAVGVLRASRDPRIGLLVSLAGMVHTADFAQRKFGDQQPGDLMWDKPDCPISEAFLDDMRSVESVLPLAGDLDLPWLLVHGTADTVVPIEESEQAAATAGDDATLVRLDDVDHVFTDAADRMATAVVEWLGPRLVPRD